MKNKDILLKEYYLVEFRYGGYGLVVKLLHSFNNSLAISCEDNTFLDLEEDYTDDLLIEEDLVEGYEGDNTIDPYDIVKIYGFPAHTGLLVNKTPKTRTMIWERRSIKKMTKKQIEKELGYEIEIIEE